MGKLYYHPTAHATSLGGVCRSSICLSSGFVLTAGGLKLLSEALGHDVPFFDLAEWFCGGVLGGQVARAVMAVFRS